MRTCPSCGFGNEETAARCQLCGRALAAGDLPVATPTQATPDLPLEATPQEPPVAAMPAPPMPPAPPLQWASAAPGPPPPGTQPPGGYPPPGFPPPGMPYPMMAPLPPPRPPLTQQRKTRQFLVGLGTGLIPLVILLVVYGIGIGLAASSSSTTSSTGLTVLVVGLIVAAIMYLAAIIAMIVCLSVARVRFIGYGLLAAVVSTPVIAPIGCGIISNLSQYFR